MTPARVFISYSHDSPEHVAAVRTFADRLRESGIDALLDQYVPAEGPAEGWPLWVATQIQSADAVLLVCNQGFERSISEKSGRGVR